VFAVRCDWFGPACCLAVRASRSNQSPVPNLQPPDRRGAARRGVVGHPTRGLFWCSADEVVHQGRSMMRCPRWWKRGCGGFISADTEASASFRRAGGKATPCLARRPGEKARAGRLVQAIADGRTLARDYRGLVELGLHDGERGEQARFPRAAHEASEKQGKVEGHWGR